MEAGTQLLFVGSLLTNHDDDITLAWETLLGTKPHWKHAETV